MVGKNGPCRDCNDRAVGCHGRCERYQEWKRDRDAILDAMNAEKAKTQLAVNYVQKNKQRVARKLGRKVTQK